MENKSNINTEIVLRILYYALKLYFNGFLTFTPEDVIKIYLEHAKEEKMTIKKCFLYLDYLWHQGFFTKVETKDSKFLHYSFVETARLNYLR